MNTQPEDRPLADLVADLMQPLMAYAALLEKAGNPSQSKLVWALLAAADLTEPAFCRTLNFPNTKRPCRSLCQRPRAGVNRGVFAFLPSAASMGSGTYWRNNVQYP